MAVVLKKRLQRPLFSVCAKKLGTVIGQVLVTLPGKPHQHLFCMACKDLITRLRGRSHYEITKFFPSYNKIMFLLHQHIRMYSSRLLHVSRSV